MDYIIYLIFFHVWLIFIYYINQIKILKNKIKNNNDLHIELIRNTIKPLKSLYICNRIIEANGYLNFIKDYIINLFDDDKLSDNKLNELINDITILKDVLISLSLFSGNQYNIINELLKILINKKNEIRRD